MYATTTIKWTRCGCSTTPLCHFPALWAHSFAEQDGVVLSSEWVSNGGHGKTTTRAGTSGLVPTKPSPLVTTSIWPRWAARAGLVGGLVLTKGIPMHVPSRSPSCRPMWLWVRWSWLLHGWSPWRAPVKSATRNITPTSFLLWHKRYGQTGTSGAAFDWRWQRQGKGRQIKLLKDLMNGGLNTLY